MYFLQYYIFYNFKLLKVYTVFQTVLICKSVHPCHIEHISIYIYKNINYIIVGEL